MYTTISIVLIAFLIGYAVVGLEILHRRHQSAERPRTAMQDIQALMGIEMPTWGSRIAQIDASGVPVCVDRASNWAELLTPQLTAAFWTGFAGTGAGRRESLIGTIFGTDSSVRAFEEYQGVGVLGSDGWNFEQTGRVQNDDRNKGFLKRFTHVEFAKGIVVERKLVDDNLTDKAFDEASGLGDSAFRKREKGAASVFKNAFTDSGTNDDGFSVAGPDGVGLCSPSGHPRSRSDTTTQSNRGTLALSESSLSTTRIAMQRFTDDRGDIMDVMPSGIIIPPELEDTAIKLGMSALEPGTNNNAVNPQQGRFRYIVWNYLTDPNDWFMVDMSRMSRMLLWLNRIPLEFDSEKDFDTFQHLWNAYMRYSYGWRDWAWVYGHSV